MFTTKSGKKYGSAFVGRKKDAMDAEKETGPQAGESDMGLSKPKTATVPFGSSRTTSSGEAKTSKATAHMPDNDPEGQNQPEGSPMPSAVVAQHGKAHTVHIAHDHTAGKHHVISTHEDGHVNESEHGSAEEAHNAGKQLSGIDAENPDEAEGSTEESESDGFNMPSLG